jgi:hypothetical protein
MHTRAQSQHIDPLSRSNHGLRRDAPRSEALTAFPCMFLGKLRGPHDSLVVDALLEVLRNSTQQMSAAAEQEAAWF